MYELSALIEIKRLKVQNANAVSGPMSWGFPAPSSFTGFVRALARKLHDVKLGGVGIICHSFEPQTAKIRGGFGNAFKLMRFPYKESWRQPSFNANKQSALIEEGRAHFNATLLIELVGGSTLAEDERLDLQNRIKNFVSTMRVAGGSVRQSPSVDVRRWANLPTDTLNNIRSLRYHWLPGFALVERRDLLSEHLSILRKEDPDTNPVDAILDLLALHSETVHSGALPSDNESIREKSNPIEWVSRKRHPGWLVPLPVGFGAISDVYEPGSVHNARDKEVPFRHVESLYSVGEWISPHRLTSLTQLLWHTEFDAERGTYLCRNNYLEQDDA